MESSILVAIQCVGIFLVTLLSFFMMRSIRSVSAKYWTIAWICLSISLASVFAGFYVAGETQHILYSIYCLGGYCFAFMLIAGCRNHVHDLRLRPSNLATLIPFAITAGTLPHLIDDTKTLFILQAAIVAVLLTIALWSLRPIHASGNSSLGERVLRAGLLLLSLDFLQYVAIMGWHNVSNFQVPEVYLRFASISDLILEIMLGFGTIMVSMEGVRRELEVTNQQLIVARDRLEQIARMDPLTEALTRHAFQSVSTSSDNGTAGCAAVIDVDNLKPINDKYGHKAGDAAIRGVAKAVRTVTRAEDLLFRWGGDEFLVLMFGISENLARKRLDALNSLLEKPTLSTDSSSEQITVSYGLSSFDALTDLHPAIDRADEAMYKNKNKKARSGTRPAPSFPRSVEI